MLGRPKTKFPTKQRYENEGGMAPKKSTAADKGEKREKGIVGGNSTIKVDKG